MMDDNLKSTTTMMETNKEEDEESHSRQSQQQQQQQQQQQHDDDDDGNNQDQTLQITETTMERSSNPPIQEESSSSKPILISKEDNATPKPIPSEKDGDKSSAAAAAASSAAAANTKNNVWKAIDHHPPPQRIRLEEIMAEEAERKKNLTMVTAVECHQGDVDPDVSLVLLALEQERILRQLEQTKEQGTNREEEEEEEEKIHHDGDDDRSEGSIDIVHEDEDKLLELAMRKSLEEYNLQMIANNNDYGFFQDEKTTDKNDPDNILDAPLTEHQGTMSAPVISTTSLLSPTRRGNSWCVQSAPRSSSQRDVMQESVASISSPNDPSGPVRADSELPSKVTPPRGAGSSRPTLGERDFSRRTLKEAERTVRDVVDNPHVELQERRKRFSKAGSLRLGSTTPTSASSNSSSYASIARPSPTGNHDNTNNNNIDNVARASLHSPPQLELEEAARLHLSAREIMEIEQALRDADEQQHQKLQPPAETSPANLSIPGVPAAIPPPPPSPAMKEALTRCFPAGSAPAPRSPNGAISGTRSTGLPLSPFSATNRNRLRLSPKTPPVQASNTKRAPSSDSKAYSRKSLSVTAPITMLDCDAALLVPPKKTVATTNTTATAATIATSSLHESFASFISVEEAQAIEAALREADEKQQEESLMLALQMQEEEINIVTERQQQIHNFSRGYQHPQQLRQQGNVRTLTRAEFDRERGIGYDDGVHIGAIPTLAPPARHPLELLEEQQQYSRRRSLPATFEPVQSRSLSFPLASQRSARSFYEEEYDDVEEVFRMNAAGPQQWNRRDRNTIIGPNNEIRTKHDLRLEGQSNAQRLALESDEYGLRAHVGTKAFNSFRQDMNKRGTQKGVAAYGTGRAGSDTDATKGMALDPHVRLLISRAINSGLIEKCNGAVKQGKEAIIYHADPGTGSDGFDVAVKIFKRIQEFRGRGDYVDGDPRYQGRSFRSAGGREQLEMWAEKEFRNLIRANRAEVPVPTPLNVKDNVIFMRFMGTEGWPAPQLKEVDIRKGSKIWDSLYTQVMEGIRR